MAEGTCAPPSDMTTAYILNDFVCGFNHYHFCLKKCDLIPAAGKAGRKVRGGKQDDYNREGCKGAKLEAWRQRNMRSEKSFFHLGPKKIRVKLFWERSCP